MGLDLRLPNITGTTEKEQLTQIKSYLYQLSQQLQWALNTVEPTAPSYRVEKPSTPSILVQPKEDAETTFESLKPLIIKSADIVTAYYEEINKKLVGKYEAYSDFGDFLESTENNFTATSTDITNKFTHVDTIVSDFSGSLQSTNDSVTNLGNALDEANTNISDIAGDIGDLDSKIDETAKGIEGDLQGVRDDLGGLQKVIKIEPLVVEVNANIRTGLLDYDQDEKPVYGIEVGQRTTVNGEEVFNKYARFTSDRLSFYDKNGSEVAYISDNKLFIRNAEITVSLKVGGFVDTVLANGDVVTRWAGMGGEQ